MKIQALYEQVTNNIVAELERGYAPWVKPWKQGRTSKIMPHNAATKRAYSGINIVILWAEREAKGYETPEWMTYQQAQEKGAQVRKGEKSTQVVFMKKLRVKDRDKEDAEKQIAMMRAYAVFNVAQIDNLPPPPLPPPLPVMLPIPRAHDFIDALQADVRYGGNMAAYIPSRDFITMPEPGQFKSEASFYATLLHEHAHWTGAEKRLHRDMEGRFGTRKYAAEELVAELTAAFLCAHLGIEGELRHAGYLANWLDLLRNDERAIFTAAAKAQQAADYLRSFSEVDDASEHET